MTATYISFSQVDREEDQIITPSWDAVASAIAKLAGGGGVLEAPTNALRGRDDRTLRPSKRIFPPNSRPC